MHKNKVLEIIQAHQEELHNYYAVKSLGLFGSVARDEAMPNSDVDLLNRICQTRRFISFFNSKKLLAGMAKSKGRSSTYSALKSPLKEQILKEVFDVA